MANLPIAVQLYTLRDIMPQDVSGTLRAVAELGYDGVEFAGLHNTPATKLRAELDSLGLKVCSAHIALNLFETELERTIETYQILGCSLLVVPWIGEHLRGEYLVKECSMAKLWQTEMLARVVDECLQLFGGYGYMLEYPISRAYMDARVQRIFAGTNEIMKVIIAKQMGL